MYKVVINDKRFRFSSAVPGPPVKLDGEAVGSNGILLSWTMPDNARNIEGYVIR